MIRMVSSTCLDVWRLITIEEPPLPFARYYIRFGKHQPNVFFTQVASCQRWVFKKYNILILLLALENDPSQLSKDTGYAFNSFDK